MVRGGFFNGNDDIPEPQGMKPESTFGFIFPVIISG